ncbi:MAG: UvrB/UvrC motif-containing protein, partial [Gammaproteobacteria bacterium]|nr:UvrB/UvrC motif-containing protein [Gammaproteobacteria bacterium]
HGKAILYADRITGSMQRAIDETDRRREKQIAYNKEHGITPKGVQKAVHDILESGYPGVPGKPREYARVAEEIIEYSAMSGKALQKKLKELDEKMHQHAKNLEFEEAAKVRDEIRKIQELNMGLGEPAVD